jgi:hypothetical protein
MELWLIGAAALLLAAPTTQAAVVGLVRDAENGEPIASAVVTLSDIDRTAVSDGQGRYAVRGVPPGPQHLTVRRIGYTPRTLHALVPADGQLEINIVLHAAPVLLRTVEVRPGVALRSVDGSDSSAFPDRIVSAAAVRNHPLLAEPDVFLALGGGEIVVHPESPSGIHVRGGASDQTAYVLDGIPIFNPYHAAGTFSAWNPDALERVQVASTLLSPALPDALSGVVTAVTRTPGPHFRAQGSMTTTQARVAADGPLGVADGGYLLSVRSGFPGVVAPSREPSYLRGGSGDLLATVNAAALGGRARVLAYDSANELDAAAVALAEGADTSHSDPGRNAYAWRSRSTGAEWSGRARGATVRFLGWSAFTSAHSIWGAGEAAPVSMTAVRRDEGLAALVERSAVATTTGVGVRVHRSWTSYRVKPAGGGAPSVDLSARTPIATVFAAHDRPLGTRLTANVALAAAASSGRVYASPQARLRWSGLRRVALSGSYARSHQFAQSLRNPESVVASVFPVDLYVGAGAPGVPVARSDRGVIAADYRLSNGARLGAQAYVRSFSGLLLVAPRTGEPFAVTGGVATGSGSARGVSLDAAMSGARYGVVASYGWQRVRLDYGDSSYVPDHAASHVADVGLIVFPAATASIRLGATAALGRRATAVAGALEWEACNLGDQGCEFAGSPRHATDRLGGARLPSYLRVDLGFRKHWHLTLAGRDALVALFGTVTNVVGRTNVFTTATDPTTGEQIRLEMRPRAPLVVGLDWRF